MSGRGAVSQTDSIPDACSSESASPHISFSQERGTVWSEDEELDRPGRTSRREGAGFEAGGSVPDDDGGFPVPAASLRPSGDSATDRPQRVRAAGEPAPELACGDILQFGDAVESGGGEQTAVGGQLHATHHPTMRGHGENFLSGSGVIHTCPAAVLADGTTSTVGGKGGRWQQSALPQLRRRAEAAPVHQDHKTGGGVRAGNPAAIGRTGPELSWQPPFHRLFAKFLDC